MPAPRPDIGARYAGIPQQGPDGFDGQLLLFAEDLREEGVAVGTSEILDAFEALGHRVQVGAVLDDHAHRLAKDVGVDVVGAQEQERPGPVDGLRDARRLLEVQIADLVDDLDQPPGPRSGILV